MVSTALRVNLSYGQTDYWPTCITDHSREGASGSEDPPCSHASPPNHRGGGTDEAAVTNRSGNPQRSLTGVTHGATYGPMGLRPLQIAGCVRIAYNRREAKQCNS